MTFIIKQKCPRGFARERMFDDTQPVSRLRVSLKIPGFTKTQRLQVDLHR